MNATEYLPSVALHDIQLPEPKQDDNSSLQSALDHRKTVRDISAAPLSMQQISNLLWAACGVNRRIGPFGIVGRTAGSASNSQEIDVYVILRGGAYRYDALDCRLIQISQEDVRAVAMNPGQRESGAQAPVQLVYVADIQRLTHTQGFQEPGLQDEEIQKSYYYVDTGLIAENVYLYAAAHGLAAWFHNCDRAGLAQALGLGTSQRVLFAQTIGYPANDLHRD